MTDLILYDSSIVQMHKLVKCKNANHHFAYLRTFGFVHLYKSTIIFDVYHKLSLTFACMSGINKSKDFTFAQSKRKNVKFKGANVKYKSNGKQIKKEENDS